MIKWTYEKFNEGNLTFEMEISIEVQNIKVNCNTERAEYCWPRRIWVLCFLFRQIAATVSFFWKI